MSKFGSYNHKNIEDKIYKYWEKNNCFKPRKNKSKDEASLILDLPQHRNGKRIPKRASCVRIVAQAREKKKRENRSE